MLKVKKNKFYFSIFIAKNNFSNALKTRNKNTYFLKYDVKVF